jgi:protein gp37
VSTTAIQWTDQVWNPTTGCDQVSPGCDHCYALTMAKRLKGMGSVKYQRDGDPRTSGPGFGLTMHQDVVDAPLRWRTPRRVFVNSMSDLFHQDVTDEFVAEVFVVMAMARRHTFQILTKRHARMRALLSSPRWIVLCDEAQSRVISRIPAGPLRRQKDRQWWREVTGPLPNVWLGVSVENQKWADIRIPALLDTPAVVRFVSAEPLLGPVRFRFSQCREHDLPGGGMCTFSCPGRTRLHWVITGGESGPGARPVDLGWVRSIRDQCGKSGVAFFHKQHGGIRPKSGGRELDGRTWDEMPT